MSQTAQRINALLVEPKNTSGPPTTPQEMQQDWEVDINIAQIPKSYTTDPKCQWWESSLSAHLGFPLKILGYGATTGFNYPVQSLFIGFNPDDEGFGKFPTAPITGGALVAQTDGVDFDINGGDQLFYALTTYINQYLMSKMDFVLRLPPGEDKVRCKKRLAMFMTKEAFHAFLQQWQRVEIKMGNKVWKEIKSPVLARYPDIKPACGFCAVQVPEGVDAKLNACSGCRWRYYCTKNCQQKDWNNHKVACKVKLT